MEPDKESIQGDKNVCVYQQDLMVNGDKAHQNRIYDWEDCRNQVVQGDRVWNLIRNL